MTSKITAILFLICLNILNSCQEGVAKEEAPAKFKELNLKPMTLVIDEVSCKQCVRDMAEVYSKNTAFQQVVFLTADPFGRSNLKLDSTVKTYARRDFGAEANKLGSFLINAQGDTIKLDVKNYKQVLGGISKNP